MKRIRAWDFGRRLSPTKVRPAAGLLVQRTETLAVAIGVTAAFACFRQVDGFERLFYLVRRFESFELDELLFFFFLCGLAGSYLAVRRNFDLHREIECRTKAECRALELAHDPLSGLPNRQLLFAQLASAISARSPFFVLLVDLDQFKPVNDLHGHAVGDQLLLAAAQRLQNLDEKLFVSRLGGDEFVCVNHRPMTRDLLQHLAGGIIQEMGRPFLIDGRTLNIGASIGIASFPSDFEDPMDLVRAADLAMYHAKQTERGTYAFFEPQFDRRARERAELEVEVRDALKSGQIIPFFQPVLDLQTQEISGFEALARWEHPTRGLLEPGAFIPIIDSLGLHDALLETILRDAVSALSAWPQETTLAVNVSSAQLHDPLFAARLSSLLHRFGFGASRLILEVTEASICDEAEIVAATFAALRATGVRLALDDFGKSYANLSWLRALKFDHLKIHGSFLNTPDDPTRKVLRAIAGLARELGVQTRAQGMESFELVEFLRELGCAHAQGFCFGGAIPRTAIGQLRTSLGDKAYLRGAGT